MSLTYGFYNSLDGDRKYGAMDFSHIFNGIIRDGVFASVGTQMSVTASGGMDIMVGIGRAWFDGTWTMNDSQLPLTLEQSEIVLNRIDAVVLETNKTDDIRANSIKIIKGTPASTPNPPIMIKNELINQYPLAYIYIGKAVSEITQANITNKVGTSDTPFVTGILDTVDIDFLVSQWGTQWDEWTNQQSIDFIAWVDYIRTLFGEDPAGALQDQIDNLELTKTIKLNYEAIISTSWEGSSAPYTQTVTIDGIKEDDEPHIKVNYSTDNTTAILQKKAWNLIETGDTGENTITFICFEYKPVTAIPIQLEVIR